MDRFPFADQDQGEVGERRQVAAGADRAALGDDGVDAAVEQFAEQLDDLGPDAGMALGQDVGPEEDRRAGFRLADGVSRAQGVAPEQVRLQRVAIGASDEDVAQRAEAGADAVDLPLGGQRVLDHGAGRHDLRARGRCERRRRAASRDLRDLGQRQMVSVE